ncbi:response regulator transcription factor [Bradyrhizobium sp. CB1717]|uniref:LuxR C-terminal-related transcriptional regulator n=1 Tax=Bradyrhizobium sp. CB1717 TaxID=3039154 RepID=UPI0024B200FD|nr:response regulator transcription factor [Bradyrhizobium sp. CB1717]WFU22156.1 response regulator transcription factor [Bradyrhizobium sp. CB1717]
MRRTNIVIADRHPVVLQGLSNVLGTESDFNVIATCSDAASCIQAIRSLAPDIAIVDPAMPELAALIVLSVSPENRSTHLVFFASSEDCGLLLDVAPLACSIVLKDVEPEALVQSLRHIANGRNLLPIMSSDSIASQEQGANSDRMMTALTDRERQIMRLVSEGLSNKEIGRRLTISVGTIKVHLHNIFQKLEISNRTVLAAIALAQHDPPTDGER